LEKIVCTFGLIGIIPCFRPVVNTRLLHLGRGRNPKAFQLQAHFSSVTTPQQRLSDRTIAERASTRLAALGFDPSSPDEQSPQYRKAVI
jgi:hypothetical protein